MYCRYSIYKHSDAVRLYDYVKTNQYPALSVYCSCQRYQGVVVAPTDC
jgi:hypothetical protein